MQQSADGKTVASGGRKKSEVARMVQKLLPRWLWHSDARQVSDLPEQYLNLSRSQIAACRSKTGRGERARRQVGDLPRIGVAEPIETAIHNSGRNLRAR